MGGKHSVMVMCNIEHSFHDNYYYPVPFICDINLLPMKVVPLISMQATWLQILNFTCKCSTDLNII